MFVKLWLSCHGGVLMTNGKVFGNIAFKLLFAAIFISFAVDIVNTQGWTVFAFICLLFATMDIVQSIRIFIIFQQSKK